MDVVVYPTTKHKQNGKLAKMLLELKTISNGRSKITRMTNSYKITNKNDKKNDIKNIVVKFIQTHVPVDIFLYNI